MRSAAFDEIRRIIREEEPPKPSTRISTLGESRTATAAHRQVDAHRLGRLVEGDLDWIVMKALEKDRTRRYETASGLAARHRSAICSDEPVQACPPSATYRLKKFVRRNKIAAAFVLLLVAAVAALAVSNVQTRRNERRATTETAKAKAVSDLLQGMLGSANPDAGEGMRNTRSGNCWTISRPVWAPSLPTNRRSKPRFARRLAGPTGDWAWPTRPSRI